MAGGMARPGVTKGQRERGEGGRDRGRGQTGRGKDRGTGEKLSRGTHCSYQNLLSSCQLCQPLQGTQEPAFAPPWSPLLVHH